MRNTRTRRRGSSKRYISSLYSIRFLEDLRNFPEAPSILSEGDSWFGYPFGKDLNDHIADMGAFNIRHFQKAGDEIVNDMMNDVQKGLLVQSLNKFKFDLLLYSGGGNDVVAEHLQKYVTDDNSGSGPHNRINKPALDERLQELKGKFLELIGIVEALDSRCPILTHGYTHIIPSDEGFEILGFKLTGPWVKPTLDRKGIDDPEHQKDIINHILDRFNEMLKELDNENELFHYVDLRSEQLSQSYWANEIHPTSAGFKRLSVHFEDKMRELVPSGFLAAASRYVS